jgi:hypothetical protein
MNASGESASFRNSIVALPKKWIHESDQGANVIIGLLEDIDQISEKKWLLKRKPWEIMCSRMLYFLCKR